MKTRLFSLMILFVLAATLPACGKYGEKGLAPDADPNQVPDLVGQYVVNGFDPLGTEYSGSLTIQPGATPGTYRMFWIVTGAIQEGEGRLQGNRLEVTWHSSPNLDRQSSGTASYTVTSKRQLYGERRVDGFPKLGTEEAYPDD